MRKAVSQLPCLIGLVAASSPELSGMLWVVRMKANLGHSNHVSIETVREWWCDANRATCIHLDPARNQDRQIIRDVCRITHHNEEAYVGALAIVGAIRSLAFNLSTPHQLFQNILTYLPDSRVRDRILDLSALPDDLTAADVASQFGSSGYVVESVPLAIYAARSIVRLPLDAVLRSAIEAGGDTDTIASLTGQIAGSWIGASQISREMIQLLPDANYIEQIANEFAGTIESAI